VVKLTNNLDGPSRTDPKEAKGRAGFHVGELPFDPQISYGAAIGLNLDSSLAPGGPRTYRYYRYFADEELGTTIAFNLANPVLAAKGAFAAVIVEPEESKYDPEQGGVVAKILDKDGNLNFHEIVTLFHDSDGVLGHNRMEYPTEAHCLQNTNSKGGCGEKPSYFTSISYKRNLWRNRLFETKPSDVYSTSHGDPGLVISGALGDPLRFRVAAPWGEQAHVFSLTGYRWPLEPQMNGSEQIFARFLAPGYSFDAPILGGFGGPFRIGGDSLFLDHRLPFAKAGLWGLIRTPAPKAAEGE
jgi:hypothetical protein